MSELRLLRPGLTLSLGWELLQSPLYADTFLGTWRTLLSKRFHCAMEDAMILLAAFWLVSLLWGRQWVAAGKRLPLLVFLTCGLAYTACSEHVNVHLLQRWAYSRCMPTLGGIGLAPLLQWLVVPLLSVWHMRRRASMQCQRRAVGDVENAARS